MCYYNNRGREQLKARKAVHGRERLNLPLFPKGHEISCSLWKGGIT